MNNPLTMKEGKIYNMKIIEVWNQIYEFLNGKKTFIVGLLMVALGLMTNNNEMVLQGIGFITLRTAIANK